jgi:hypothetical protein
VYGHNNCSRPMHPKQAVAATTLISAPFLADHGRLERVLEQLLAAKRTTARTWRGYGPSSNRVCSPISKRRKRS